ncbi:hypothetical protein COL922a_014589, partial [Colletotrichum nupharicola]
TKAEVLPPRGSFSGSSINAPTYTLYDENGEEVRVVEQKGAQKSNWEDYMILKVNRFDLK